MTHSAHAADEVLVLQEVLHLVAGELRATECRIAGCAGSSRCPSAAVTASSTSCLCWVAPIDQPMTTLLYRSMTTIEKIADSTD